MAKIAYLCNDLLFTSKIRETATQLGHDAVRARDVAGLPTVAAGAAMVIIDLRLPAALDALASLRSDEKTRSVPAIGFCDHERVELMEEARRAGCATVLAKGKFTSDLKSLLPQATARAPQ